MVRDGYIKLHRAVLDSYLWSMKPDHTMVAMTCLLLANWREGSVWSAGQKVVIPRGSFMTSIDKLAKASRVSPKVVRTALANLERAGFLANQSTSRHRIISITNYEDYQSRDDDAGKPEGKAEGRPRASQGQSSGKPRATIEEGKKGRREERDGGEPPALSLVPGEPKAEPDAKARALARAGVEELRIGLGSGCRVQHGSKTAVDLCKVLAKDGATVEQMREVVRAKVAEWKGDAAMERRLVPSTLFARKNWLKYLEEDVPRSRSKPASGVLPADDPMERYYAELEAKGQTGW